MDFNQEREDRFWRIGLHYAFPPTEDEIDFSGVDPEAFVTDTLMAYPVMNARNTRPAGKTHGPMRIRMINPSTWRHLTPGRPERDYARPKTPDDFGEYPPDDPDEQGDEAMPIAIEVDEGKSGHDDDDDEEEEDFSSEDDYSDDVSSEGAEEEEEMAQINGKYP